MCYVAGEAVCEILLETERVGITEDVLQALSVQGFGCHCHWEKALLNSSMEHFPEMRSC